MDMEDRSNMVICSHCGKTGDKKVLSKSCSNCFACTGCEAYICQDCRYEIVITPPKPMKRVKHEE